VFAWCVNPRACYVVFGSTIELPPKETKLPFELRRRIAPGRAQQTESDFRPKGNRERCLPLEPWLAAELESVLAATNGDYILTGHMSERCDDTFRRLNAWLTVQGWDRRLKVHELRKLFGSLVTQQAGIRAAQVLLGHANVSTTEACYADPAASIVPIRIFQAA
jgi:integrase